MDEQQNSNIKSFRILSNDSERMLKAKYSIEDVVEMIKKGTIALSIDTIKGVHGATYIKTPCLYNSEAGQWSNTEFVINDKPYLITTVTDNEVSWYHLPQILKMLNLFTSESDSKAFESGIPYEYKRSYMPWGKGSRRTFVSMDALEGLGLSSNGKPVIKKRVPLQYSGLISYSINMDCLKENVIRIMNELPVLDDRLFMCDVYRVLSCLE